MTDGCPVTEVPGEVGEGETVRALADGGETLHSVPADLAVTPALSAPLTSYPTLDRESLWAGTGLEVNVGSCYHYYQYSSL